jgi:hypothetical protein
MQRVDGGRERGVGGQERVLRWERGIVGSGGPRGVLLLSVVVVAVVAAALAG